MRIVLLIIFLTGMFDHQVLKLLSSDAPTVVGLYLGCWLGFFGVACWICSDWEKANRLGN